MTLLIKMNVLKWNIENIKIERCTLHNGISTAFWRSERCNMERSIDNLVNFEKVILKY